jgi:hypothetical protein
MPTRIEDCEARVETDSALLIIIDGEEEWVPKSVIHDDSEVYEEGGEGTLVVEDWFARKKGWA